MPKKMIQQDGEIEIEVLEHIILRNFWEYYVYEEPDENGITYALVVGADIEMGAVSLYEIRPYIITRTTDLDEVMPAPGWRWDE